MHKVAILVLDEVIALDMTIPLEVFTRARDRKGRPCYDVVVCGPTGKVSATGLTLLVKNSLKCLSKADTIVVPGTAHPFAPISPSVHSALLKAHARGARLVSICGGAFILAEAGLLDGLKATTHWLGTDELKARYPLVDVDPNVLYVDSGQILTSAGVCAGMDLCLHIVRKDFGAAVAAESARLAVMPLERAGGQAQFISHEVPNPQEGTLQPVLEWIESNLHRDLSIESIAKKAAMSVRTLNRQFHKQVGSSPLKWLQHARLRRARVLLETTAKSLDSVAEASGFGSAITMREQFRNQMQTSPKAYRDSYRR